MAAVGALWSSPQWTYEAGDYGAAPPSTAEADMSGDISADLGQAILNMMDDDDDGDLYPVPDAGEAHHVAAAARSPPPAASPGQRRNASVTGSGNGSGSKEELRQAVLSALWANRGEAPMLATK